MSKNERLGRLRAQLASVHAELDALISVELDEAMRDQLTQVDVQILLALSGLGVANPAVRSEAKPHAAR